MSQHLFKKFTDFPIRRIYSAILVSINLRMNYKNSEKQRNLRSNKLKLKFSHCFILTHLDPNTIISLLRNKKLSWGICNISCYYPFLSQIYYWTNYNENYACYKGFYRFICCRFVCKNWVNKLSAIEFVACMNKYI